MSRDEDGHRCRKKITCSVSFRDKYDFFFESIRHGTPHCGWPC